MPWDSPVRLCVLCGNGNGLGHHHQTEFLPIQCPAIKPIVPKAHFLDSGSKLGEKIIKTGSTASIAETNTSPKAENFLPRPQLLRNPTR